MKKLLPFQALLLMASILFGQMPNAITIEPLGATAYDEITLTFDPAEACFESASLVGLPFVAMHSGVCFINGDSWQHIVDFNEPGINGQPTTLMPTGDGRYAITFIPKDFYGFPDESVVTEICAVFNNGSGWSNDGRDFAMIGELCRDFFIPIHYPGDGNIFVPQDFPNVQAGIDEAEDGDFVIVDTGSYFENINFKGKAITVASHFLLDGDTNHINNTILDGSQPIDPDSASVVAFVSGEDTNSVIMGFTITGGTGVIESSFGIRSGGGIYCYNSGCKIINNHITDNHVEGDTAGGAGLGCIMLEGDHWSVIDQNIINYNTSTSDGFSAFGGGMAVLTNSIISNNIIEFNTCTNTVGSVDGGGIEIEKWPEVNPSSTICNNIIRYNEIVGAVYANGAGIMNYSVPVVIENNLIVGNSAASSEMNWGGGIAAWNVTGGITINSNTIDNNSLESSHCYGGGVQIYNSNIVHCVNNNMNHNSGRGTTVMAGGAFWLHTANDSVILEGNTIYHNITFAGSNSVGGGMGIYISNDNEIIIAQNKIGKNAAKYGGGLYTFNTNSSSITNNFFVENEGTYGGAMYFRQYDEGAEMVGGFDSGFNPPKTQRTVQSDPIPVLINNTFLRNMAASTGGAISTDHTLAIPLVMNSIFWENESFGGNDIYNNSSEAMLVAYCDIDPLGILGNWTGESNVNIDPVLNEDGYHLSWSSPCANAGIDSVEVNGNWYYSPQVDIDGDVRPYLNTRPDIGADEKEVLHVNVSEGNEDQGFRFKVFPNPFSTSTTIEYELQQPSTAQISIYNQLGEQIEVIQQIQLSGQQQFTWSAEGLPNGVYYCVLQTAYGTLTTKMIILN